MKRNIFLILLLLLVLGTQIYSSTEILRGIWMYSATLTSTPPDVISEKLYVNNVTDVYVLVKGSNGVLPDSIILANFIKEAHKKSIKVHFWYGISADAVFLGVNPDAPIYHSPKPGVDNKPYIAPNETRLNFLYPGYKEYVMKNITWLLKSFDCDGIQLDAIRYTHLVYSFDQYHIAKAKESGCNTDRLLQLFIDNYANYSGIGWINGYVGGDEDIVKWVNMRKSVVFDYISSIKDLINQHKPGIELSAQFTPELSKDAMAHYSQDYTLCTPKLDRVIPTAFTGDYGQGAGWIKAVTEGAKAISDTNCIVTTGVQITTGMTPEVLDLGIKNAIEGTTSGILVQRYELLTDDLWTKVKDLFTSVLPVELASFSASTSESKIVLTWETVTEANNQGFEIQKKSEFLNWKTIGFVRGSGTTSDPKIYSFTDNSGGTGKYTYRLKQIDYDGNYVYSKETEVSASAIKNYSLLQNYPNPFNPSTTIKFNLPENGFVTLKLFNILGSEISTILSRNMEAGSHTINFDAHNLPSGIYLYQLNVNDFTSIKRMVLTK